jgi:hypothetical protein
MTLDDKLRIVVQGNNGVGDGAIGLVFFAAPNLVANLATKRSIVATSLSTILATLGPTLLCGLWCGIIDIFIGGLNFGCLLATIIYLGLNTNLECGVH